MKTQHKHLYLARRKMSRIFDEIYTALLHCGSNEVSMRIVREESGLRLYAEADFDHQHQEDLQRMKRLLQPAVRSAAMVEEYWELAGEDQYASESELALVGQMCEEANVKIDSGRVCVELYVTYS